MRRWDGVYRIGSPFIKREGPDGKIHEGWCSIFEREDCGCRPDDDDDGEDDGGGVRGGDGGTRVKKLS